MMDTIFALASGVGKAGVSVIRVSGPHALSALRDLAGSAPAPRHAGLRTLTTPKGDVIDQAVCLLFPGPGSFTGEDVVEFHVHGSLAVVSMMTDTLGDMPGLRLAEPGEFTRRALENEKMDLAEVEGLADLIDAETEAQRRQAQRLLDGALRVQTEIWRVDLIRAAALLEATIDFADEEVPEDVSDEVADLLAKTRVALDREVQGSHVAERVRTGFEVAIIGAPNAGKSTLLNRLAGRDAAITSETAGTTRDVIEVRMDLGGLPVTLLDTAGLRKAEDAIERIGVERALERAAAADLRVFLRTDDPVPDVALQDTDITVRAKGDLVGDPPDGVSGVTGAGVDSLVTRITAVLKGRAAQAGIATRARHRQAMQKAMGCLAEAESLLDAGADRYDLTAEEIRSAVRALDSLIGRVDVENLLDEIFASFCLGK